MFIVQLHTEVIMKLKLSILVIALSLTACSSMKTGNGTNSSTPIVNQKLSTSFVAEGVKIETKCSWAVFGKDECQLVGIEAIGTAPTFGNTTSNRKNALTRAQMSAERQVAEFLQKEVTTSRVQNTIAKNIEKASDKVKSGKSDDSTVEMTDKEAGNISLRENNNDTVVTLTETVRTSAKSILSGFVKVDEKVIGDQEVAVTIRWDVESNVSRKQLLKAMQ
jgi:hypothetical protein